MRTIISLLALIIFCAVYSWYLFLFTHIDLLPIHRLKLLYYYNLGGMLLFCFIDKRIPCNETYHAQMNDICFSAVLVNIVILILYFHNVLLNHHKMIYLFNGSIFVVSLIVFINAWRYGYFKNRYEND